MFIIKSGEVVVMGPDGTPSHHLGDGAFFGEICLLDTSLKRTASVRSVQQCELYTLSKEALDEVRWAGSGGRAGGGAAHPTRRPRRFACPCCVWPALGLGPLPVLPRSHDGHRRHSTAEHA